MSDLRRLEQLFQSAADLPEPERDAFLDAQNIEPELRRRVLDMLADLERGGTLERPALDPVEGSGPSAGLVDPGDLSGSRVGRYKLLEAIGEGGFGVVYRAEQVEPVRRQVALKVIKVGMDTREVVARFEAERQALAMMDHPGIAKVLDGGMTEKGRPYFVMELVRGLPITDYCDRESLDPKQRLELFLDVCHAVQHAHQKGVVHRDLKPSNILVSVQDGAPAPKVIDFGVAKAMHGRLTDKTLFTAYHRFVGTPAYMSPEQAESSALDIDTRADVYSLGVVLYELLTGSTPFEREELARAGLAEIQRILREERPPRPSTRVSTAADAVEVARRRRVEASELSKRLKGDLDWIAMKALEKERGRRYPAVSELAADLRRHLDNEPVSAGPPSRSYRLKKFLVRYRAAVVSALLLLLTLFGGIVGTGIGLWEASLQRDAAQLEADRARRVTDFLVRTLTLADPEVALDPALSVRALLDRASAQVPDFFVGQPMAEGRVHATLGQAFESLAELPRAELHLRRAIELMGPEAIPDEQLNEEDLRERYEVLWTLTHVLFRLERPDAFELAQAARTTAHGLIARSQPELAKHLDLFIDAMRTGGHSPDPEPFERAAELLDRAIRHADRVLPEGHRLWPLVADTCMDGAFSLWYTPHEALSEGFLEHALRIRRRELAPGHADIGEVISQLAGVLARNGRPADAEVRLAEAVEELAKTFPEDSFQLAFARSMLGENLTAQGKFEQAETLLVKSHRTILALSEDEATFFPIDSYGRVIRLYDAWGAQDPAKHQEGETYRLGLARVCARSHWPITWPFAGGAFGPDFEPIAKAAESLEARLGAQAYTVVRGEVAGDGLEADLLRLFELQDQLLTDDHPLTQTLARVAVTWMNALGDPRLRVLIAERVVGPLDSAREVVPLDLAEILSIQACDTDDPSRLDEALELARSWQEDDSWYTANAKARIARCFVERGRESDARSLLEPAALTLEAQLGPTSRDYQEIHRLLNGL